MVLIGMVIVCLMMAVDFQFRIVEGTRPKIEEAQLARILLHRIAEDVRNVTPKGPTAASSSDSEDESSGATGGASGGTQSQTGANGNNSQDNTSGSNGQSGTGNSNNQNNANGGNNNPNNPSGGSNGQTGANGNNQTGASGTSGKQSGASGGTNGQTGATKSGTSSQKSSTSTDSLIDTSTSPPAAGLRGGTDWIQVDVCRLPRFDQWQSLLLAAESGVSPSQMAGLKTVSYFLRADDSLTSADTSQDSQTSGGLMRREIDWAPGTTVADTQETPTESNEDARSLASEVTELGFRYSDGTDWLDEWDSTESGQLPVAVEITLSIRPRRQTSQQDPLAAEDTEANSLIYRLVVNLPAAQTKSDEILTDMPSASEQKDSNASNSDQNMQQSSESDQSSGEGGNRRRRQGGDGQGEDVRPGERPTPDVRPKPDVQPKPDIPPRIPKPTR